MGVKDYWKKSASFRKVVWGIYKLPGLHFLVKKPYKYWTKARTSRHLYKVFPEYYNARKNRPIDENKVLIIDAQYDHLTDSFQLLYDELTQKYNYDVKTIFLLKPYVPITVYYDNVFKMLDELSTAKYVFVNLANEVIAGLDLRPETTITNLWHACGAFKRFGISTADKIFGPSAESYEKHPRYSNVRYVTVSSPEIIWAYEEAMGFKPEDHVVQATGVSRTDVFFKEDTIRKAEERIYEKFPAAKDKKIILYAPTFRGRVRTCTSAIVDVEAFYKEFGEDYVLIVKHHPMVKELPELPKDLIGSFVYDGTRDMDIQDLLCVTDICISDYSSLIFEYSLFNKPMLFYAFDLEDYFDWRGFYYNYDELTPGPVCKTNEEMIDYIKHVDERFDKQAVIDFRNKFMSSCDGHATQRIMELVFGRERLAQHLLPGQVMPEELPENQTRS